MALTATTLGVLGTLWAAGAHNALHWAGTEGVTKMTEIIEQRSHEKMTHRTMTTWVQGFEYGVLCGFRRRRRVDMSC